MKNTLSIQELFNDRIFRIPGFQRGYAWEIQQVGEFLDDLSLLDSSRHHYTGTIVLYQEPESETKKDAEGTNYTVTQVVDGQQRLTTVVILLNELSKALGKYSSSESLSFGTRKKYVTSRDRYGLDIFKLSLNDDTKDFFQDSVLSETAGTSGPKVASARRLREAQIQIADYLTEVGDEEPDREKWLNELHDKVTMQLRFNLYEVDSEAEVGVIFEVMNDRGKPLTDLEKVKNYLLYTVSALKVEQSARDELTQLIHSSWAIILNKLMLADMTYSYDENQLLRSHWIMDYDPRTRNWKGSKSIRSRFDLRQWDHGELLLELHRYVRGLRDASTSFCDAHRPGRGGDAFDSFDSDTSSKKKVVLWNQKLVRIGIVSTFVPLLMAVRKRWPSEPRKYLDVLELCERISFRIYRVAMARPTYRQPAMYRLAHRIAQGCDFDDAVRQVRREYSDVWPRQRFSDFANAENSEPLYGWRGLKYLLYEYEEHLAISRGKEPEIKWQDIESQDTIEHILPQSIDKQSYWEDRFDKDSHEKYKHDIGNLTLTKGNPSLGQKPFPQKRKAEAGVYCYSSSPLFEEQEIAENWEHWTKKSIEERRAIMLGWASERWRVDFGDETHAEVLDDEDGDDDEA